MYRLTLDALLTVDAIDRLGSFSAAAEGLHKVPSTVSYTVARLEDQLGVALFLRNGPRVTLTPAGSELLREGRWLLAAAADLESRVKRIATGYETELRLVHDSLVRTDALVDAIAAFEALDCGTRLKITTETMTGTWEALREGRADLVLAVGDAPSGGGQQMNALATIDYAFCLAPGHPLARVKGRLDRHQLMKHTAIVVADSARLLPGRTIGLRSGQSRITVADIAAKLSLQVAGLGHGFLPRSWAADDLRRGRLLEREVDEPKPAETLWLAWRTDSPGRALSWWRERLLASRLLG